MQDIIATITATLGVTTVDTYLLFGGIVLVGILMALGLETIYQAFFGAILGLGIYILLSTLMAAGSWKEGVMLVSDRVGGLIVGSSIYLIFLLGALVPLNGAIGVPVSHKQAVRVGISAFLAVLLVAFGLALYVGFSERIGIFNRENIFSLLRIAGSYSGFQETMLHAWTIRYLQFIVLGSVLVTIYKLLFSEMVVSMAMSVLAGIQTRRGGGGGGGGAHHAAEDFGGHDDHDAHDDHHGH